jgi:hypothetical protein
VRLATSMSSTVTKNMINTWYGHVKRMVVQSQQKSAMELSVVVSDWTSVISGCSVWLISCQPNTTAIQIVTTLK